jgi:prepilin-type N-terminal cleavage/methylation domain-containing protein
MKTSTKGFALTELIVVMAIIGIILGIVSLNFSTWQKKYNIENQAKEMMADLNDVRLKAMHTKTNRMVVMNSDHHLMTFRSYTAEEAVTATTGAEYFRKNLKYPVFNDPAFAEAATCSNMIFGPTGITSDLQTIYIASTGTGAAVDCLAISITRINLGQSNGAKCVYQ